MSLPPPEPFTIEQFYKFLQQGKLMAGICQKCQKVHLPPRPLSLGLGMEAPLAILDAVHRPSGVKGLKRTS